MEAVEFKEMNVKIAEHQKEFQTLPAHFKNEDCSLIYCFELNEADLEEVNKTKRIYFKQFTGGAPMQPINANVKFKELDQ